MNMSEQPDSKSNNTSPESALGLPEYNYTKFIKTPDQLGMSSAGDLMTLGDDIQGLIAYTDLLISGKSDASIPGRPFGPKYFVKTPLQCGNENGDQVARYIYFNFVPDGTIPLLKDAMGGKGFDDLRGLIPGVISNVAQMDPAKILIALASNSPDNQCTKITMETIDKDNVVGVQSEYVSNVDITNMDSVWFKDGIKPSLSQSESFVGYNSNDASSSLFKTKPKVLVDVKKNNIIQIMYYNTIGIIGIYIILKLLLNGRPH